MNPIYVTYTRTLHNGEKSRFAVQCSNQDETNEVKNRLKTRHNVSNIRLNKTGRNLPEECMVRFYAEYMYNYGC